MRSAKAHASAFQFQRPSSKPPPELVRLRGALASGKKNPPANKRRILVVEDDPVVHDAMRRLFQGRGWEVTIAPTLREALVALAQPIEWIVLDLLLPDGDGLDVLELVHRKCMGCRIVVVTSATDPDHLRSAADYKPQALLDKPVDFERLLRIIG